MSGDLNINEQLIIVDKPGLEAASFSQEAAPEEQQAVPGRVLHVYGDRVRIIEQQPGVESKPVVRAPTREFGVMSNTSLSELENLGVAAFNLRSSAEYAQAKQNRVGQGQEWNFPPGGCTGAPVPEAEALMEDIKAPDFPTGAQIYNQNSIQAVYETFQVIYLFSNCFLITGFCTTKS